MENVLRIRPTMGRVVLAERTIPVADIELGGVPRGAVLILCEPGELSATAANLGNRLAEHGFESTTADLGAVLAEGSADAVGTSIVRGLLEHVAGRGWALDQVGVIGYGAAGRGALLAATALPIGAAVSVAPHIDDVFPDGIEPPPALSVPWLGMFALDDGADTDRIAALGAATERASSAFTTVVAYAHVSGAFYHHSREPVEHAAAFDSWQRTLEWLNLRVVPRPTPLALAWSARRPAA